MGVVIRKSIIISILTYLGVAIGYFNNLWLLPYVLDPDKIGLIRVIIDMAFVFLPFAQLGLPQTTIKFFPHFNQSVQAKKEFMTLLLGGVFIGYFLFLGFFLSFRAPILSLFAEKSPLVIEYHSLVVLLILIIAINSVLESFCRSLIKVVVPALTREVFVRVFLSIAVLLYFIKAITFHQLLFFVLIDYALVLLILLIYLILIKEFTIGFKFKFLNLAYLRKITAYSLYALLGGGATLIVLKIDSIMVTSMLGLTETAIYTTAFFIAVVIEMPQRAARQVLFPLVARAFANNDKEEIEKLYKKGSLNLLIIGFLVFLVIWINIDNLYAFVPKREVFEAGKMVVFFIAIGKLVDMGMSLNGEIILSSRYYKFNVIAIAFLACFTIFLNYLLIPRWGINGAAIASSMAIIFFNVSKLIFVWVVLKLQPFTRDTVKVFLIALFTFLISYFLPPLSNIYIDIFLKTMIIVIPFTVLIYFSRASTDINEFIKKAINKFL